MSIFDRIKSFEFDRNKEKMFGVKSAIVWGHYNGTDASNFSIPLLYISKPKGISQLEYEELLDSIDIQFIKK